MILHKKCVVPNEIAAQAVQSRDAVETTPKVWVIAGVHIVYTYTPPIDKCTRLAGGTANHRFLGEKSADWVAACFDKDENNLLLLLLLLWDILMIGFSSIVEDL